MNKRYPYTRFYPVPLCLGVLLLAACTPIERLPERTMGLNGGPDLVFARPVAGILPQLENAVATDNNGRVGNELVFWEYRLPDTSLVNLFACFQTANDDCDERINAICPGGGQVLARGEEPGQVRQMNCSTVGIARPGELYPNCQVINGEQMLLVGLTQCQ